MTTFCLAMGSRKQLNDIREELEIQPLMCGNFETKLKDSFKWLGQTLSSGGLSKSVGATVEAREGKTRSSESDGRSDVTDRLRLP